MTSTCELGDLALDRQDTQYSAFATFDWDVLNRLVKQVTSETGGAHYTYRAVRTPFGCAG